jgi:hypothetical protein
MPSIGELVLSIGLGLWVLATVVGQFPCRQEAMIRSADLLSLVPRWYLFAPRPWRADYWLLYRVGDASGPLSNWVKAQCVTSVPASIAAIINPGRRELKTFLDVIQDLLERAARADSAPLETTAPYLYILAVASTIAAPLGSQHVQFAVVRRDSEMTASPRHLAVFVSRWHRSPHEG